MFTRYNGMGIPENYSGVRFREAAQTEMKTHKPSPSYTSTRTSVSPMFASAQLQRHQPSPREESKYRPEAEYERSPETEYEYSPEGAVEYHSNADGKSCSEEHCDSAHERASCKDTKENVAEKQRPLRASDVKETELSGLLAKIFKEIDSSDLILLAVIFLLLGGENERAKSSLLPLILLLLYS